jgi:hypothetical protein
MKRLTYSSISEFGVDYGLQKGRFNTVANDNVEAFSKYWWGEVCRFEKYLIEKFSAESIFVSDHVPDYKSFTVTPAGKLALDQLCEIALAYLEREHPDASLAVAHPFDSVMPSGSLILTVKEAWIEQDINFWVFEKSVINGAVLPGLNDLRNYAVAVDIRKALSWFNNIDATPLGPKEFWSLLYSGEGIGGMGRSEREETKAYSVGGQIVNTLSERYWVLEEDETCDVYISSSLPKHRIIKIECTRARCDQLFVQEILRIVRKIDKSWTVRFAIFEDLVLDNSYLGGIIVKPDNQFIIEG